MKPLNPDAIVVPFGDEKEWHALRGQDVTSTESPALFGMSPYVTHFELWHRKKDQLQIEFKPNDRMRWGNHLEAGIAAGIAAEQGWEIAPLKEYMRIPGERIGSSFDFVILNHPSGQPAHLEIKNVDYLAFRDNWTVHDDGFAEAPEHIELQVQHQMMVSGFPRAYIGALIGGNRGFLIERERDEQVIAALRARIRDFWRTIDAGEEPPPVMPEDAQAVIKLNQYADPGKVLNAATDEKIAKLVREYQQAKDEEKLAKERAEVLKAELFQAIGDAEKVILADCTLSASMIADTPPTVITPEMVGQTYGGRKGYRNLRISKRKA